MSAASPLLTVLQSTALALVDPGKGILAADESFGTLGRRFASHDIPFTRENRHAYRELLATTPGLGDFISGMILFEETLEQTIADGTSLPAALVRQGIIPGVKVDTGTRALSAFPGETTTRGLDNLRARLAHYAQLGARFTKWRATFAIGDGRPTSTAIETNARMLALFAATSQEAGLVPIVEPEVLITGHHTLVRCGQITHGVLESVFARLNEHRVERDGMLLKASMVLPGEDCAQRASDTEIAETTLEILRQSVPTTVPGIVFLSGGQDDVETTERLNAICQRTDAGTPWRLSFSFGRALQHAALKIWGGDAANVPAAQAELLQRARLNALAVQGTYPVGSERTFV